ncbi:MAG: hypothetical protein EBZ36_00535 [Acidobacteria bacterium]|jgi:predicted GH43/DUF377 family glycosyl hydrolase|nr:hypothetical protein [Acidobacteriota bacterium]
MRWVKRGIVYCPDGQQPWARSHAMLPTPLRLNEEVVRVYVTFLDGAGIGRPGYVDVAASDPTRVLEVSTRPLLADGLPGTFDENGMVACSVVRANDGRILMYYVGFETGTRIRYRLLTGLAISEDNGATFSRYRPTPILERSPEELYFRAGPFCLYEPPHYRLWYAGGSQWTDLNGKSVPVYEIRYLESDNGYDWARTGEVQIKITDSDEHGFGRPYVIGRPEGGYRMFYSVRRRSCANYRLGYAESTDGRHWRRMDRSLNLDVTPGSFDSEAIMYAAPILVDEKLYLFYNGNEFGRAGFALAELETA